MRAGKRRHHLTIEQETEVRSDAGSPVNVWDEVTPFAIVWGAISPISGREQMTATVTADVTHDITIPYLKGLTPKMRIKYQHSAGDTVRIFAIVSVRDIDERNREMRLLCREGEITYGVA